MPFSNTHKQSLRAEENIRIQEQLKDKFTTQSNQLINNLHKGDLLGQQGDRYTKNISNKNNN